MTDVHAWERWLINEHQKWIDRKADENLEAHKARTRALMTDGGRKNLREC